LLPWPLRPHAAQRVGIKDREQGREVAALRCSEKRADHFALPCPVGLRLGACTLDSPAPTARELSRRHRRAADDRCNLIERDIEHVMQHECDPLRRRQGLEHNQHRNADGIRDQLSALQIVGRGESLHFGIDRDFTPRLPSAEHVDADARNDCREPAGKIVNAACAGTHNPKKALLHRVIGLGLRTEHPVGNPI
jgi:hypothetical protein